MPVSFKLHYAPAAAGAGAIDVKRTRARHPLYEDAGSTRVDGWLLSAPRDGAALGGAAGVFPGTIAKICMAFVTCGDDIVERTLADYGLIKDAAWTRFIATLATIHGGEGATPITLGSFYEDIDAKISRATPAQRADLTLRLADLDTSIALVAAPTPPPAGNTDAALQEAYVVALAAWEGGNTHPYACLRELKFGMLRDDSTGHLHALGRLMCALPSWAVPGVRSETAFKRALQTLGNVALEGQGLGSVHDAADAADCLASKLKRIDIPRAMESFGGPHQESRSRALISEMRAVDSAAVRQDLLRDRLIGVVARLPGVRALLGVRNDGGCELSGPSGFALLAEVATRMGIVRNEADFAWAQLRALCDEIGHLDEMLRAEPWVGRTARERADHAIDLHRAQARRASAASTHYSTPDRPAGGHGSDSALTAAEARIRGSVPKHFQGDLSGALAQKQYIDLKRDILAAVAAGGSAAMLNALQIAASGVGLDHTNSPKARVWCPLIALLAEGSSRGIDAAALDPELQVLTDAARDTWPELIGRTAGLQLALDGVTLPTELVGWEMPELAKAFQSSDWRHIDLGAAFEAARAKMRNEPFEAGPAADAYTTRANIENAIEVAESLLSLRGFGGNGKGTLPYILDEIRTSWMLYGGKGAHPKTLTKLKEEGRAYAVATLEHFGRVRHAALATKNPRAPDHARKTTPAAEQRWALHVSKLQGSLDLAGYADYFGGDGSGGGAGGRSEGDGGGGGSRDGGGGAKKQKKRAATEDTVADTRGVQMALDLRRKTLTITSAADALGNALVKANVHGGVTQAAGARSALAMILALGGVSLAVVVMLVPPNVHPSSEAIAEGFSWQRAAAAAGLPRHTIVCVAEQFIRRWVSAVADIHVVGGRTGIAEAQPTSRALNAERLAYVDLAAAAREEASALLHVSAGLLDAAAREPRLADALLCWREKVTTAHDVSPPALVAALGREPPATLAAKPFAYRCTIPSTTPVEMRGMAPRWPVGVPRPASMLDTYSPQARKEIRAQLDAVERWNAARVSGALEPRPIHKSWSDKARLPWFQNRVLWERDGKCEIVDGRFPATRIRMHREAALWLLRDYPHRQLVSFLVHGVTLHDGLPLQTSIAANLLSFYEVRGGPDAVAEEMHGLKERGWYLSSAGLSATAETPTKATTATGTMAATASTASPAHTARLLTSPARVNPRGAVPRKDLGPPRGVAELGYPRRQAFTVDTGEIVTSVNVATSTEHSATTGDEFWARKEVKPRPGDLMLNLLILRAMGNLLRAAACGTAPATLLILFDYKYFFHALAYMAGEVWKTGCAVPAREAPGKASRTRLDVLLELVLAMGWTQASKIAQDFANALMWLLLHAVDVALAPHIAELRAMSTEFDEMWRGRLALEHDDYGTQARIVTALQYTDDSVKACLGATATTVTIVEFCRLIGPRFYSGPDAHESARGTVTRSVIDEYGVALQAWRQLTPKGSVRAIGRDGCEPSHTRTISTGRGTLGGNPFPITSEQDAQRVTAGYACLLASVPGTTARDVGALLGLRVASGYEQTLSDQLQAHANDLAERVLAGDHLALQCPGCRSPLQRGRCHSLLLAMAVAQRCSIALEIEAGPPADPVTAPPRPALGLDLEAAKMHKWHLGGSGIWTGVGMSASALVTWVPQSKAARCLVEILEVLEGRCDVSRYRSLHGALADLVLPTGGGWYRMQGMAVPLRSDQELGEGPNVIVRERPQLWSRLKAWQKILANSPGAAMVAVLPAAHSARRTDVVTWDIGGDAAKDGEPKQGLGAWFYGVWWCAPLGDWPVLAAAHITCLELIEVGLGVVMATRWLSEAKRVRLRADATAAFLTVRARRDSGALSRGAKAAELVAAHEVIMRQPEWVQLHNGHEREVLVEQTFGESMLLHDAASRNNVELIRDVAAALGISPKRLELSARARTYLHDVSQALLEVRGAAPQVPMHATALEHGAAGNGSGPRTPFSQAWPGAMQQQTRSDVRSVGAPRPAPLTGDEQLWLLYEAYLVALDDEALAGLPSPPPSDSWDGSPRSIDSFNNWEPPDFDPPDEWSPGEWFPTGLHRAWSPGDYPPPDPPQGYGYDTGAGGGAVDTGVTSASLSLHVPMHAAAIEHGAAANGTGPRTPFAQAETATPAPGLQALLRSIRDGQADHQAEGALKRARQARAVTAHAHGTTRALWTPVHGLDLSHCVETGRARRLDHAASAPTGDADSARAAAFTAALARATTGRARYRGPGADQSAPSKSVVTAQAVAPPRRAIAVAQAALHMPAPTPAAAISREAAELEESQRLLIERSLHDARCDDDGLGIRGASDEFLRGLLTAAMLAVEQRFAPSTRGQDRSYWRMWTSWCDLVGTPPLRTNSAANEGRIEHLHRREVALALGAFMTWAAEAEQRGYKIESMLNRLRGVARRHWAVTIRFVSLSLVVQAAQGLVREHIDAHGADSLRRRSKEPFDTAEIVAILNLPAGTCVAHGSSVVTVGENLEWQGVVVFINLFCTGGWRKEAIALGPKEAFGGRKLSLGEVTYRIGGVLHREPTVQQLLRITWNDLCYINPVPCKNDPDNSKFGSSPVPSRYHATQPICLVRELAKYEIMRMRADPVGTAAARRKDLPLVLSPTGRSWSKAELSKFFDGLLRLVCSEERARQLSVHSFRVWLACALLAAGATPEQIMLMVRWSSEAARKLYARLAMTTQCSLHTNALHASFDSIRAHTLLDASSATGASSGVDAAAEALRIAVGLLDTVTDASGARVASAADLRRTCAIDEDDVFSMLEASSDALEGLAARADAALTDTGAPAPDSESEDEP
jgi:hypothetical protein